MKLVRIIKDWDYPDLMQQTPGGRGIWDNAQFTVDAVQACDYVIVLNRITQPVTVYCPPEHIWHFTQEPPVPETSWSRHRSRHYYRLFTPDISEQGPRNIHSHTALPWHVSRSYDFLKRISPPEKPRTLSWITSKARFMSGHDRRLNFLSFLQANLEFDLWGRGFIPIEDKWDGLAPYRYALAVENYSGPHYWTEKLADCYLAWTMPIYYGCTNIGDYFPPESMIKIDITKPEEALEIIRDSIARDLFLTRRDAVAEARQRVLEQYQFFPFVIDYIKQFAKSAPSSRPRRITLKVDETSWHQRLIKQMTFYRNRIRDTFS